LIRHMNQNWRLQRSIKSLPRALGDFFFPGWNQGLWIRSLLRSSGAAIYLIN
jgi:hypothetical protein